MSQIYGKQLKSPLDITSSWANNAVTASYAMNGGSGGTGFPFSGSAVITGSLLISGSGLIVSGGITGSVQGIATNIAGGTDGYIPLWSGSTTLTSSFIYQSGSVPQFQTPAVNVNNLATWTGYSDVYSFLFPTVLPTDFGYTLISSTTSSITLNGDITLGGSYPLPWIWTSIELTDNSANYVTITDPYYNNISSIVFYSQSFNGANYTIFYSSSTSPGTLLPNNVYTSVSYSQPHIIINSDVEISGSQRLTASNITGSLFGTASWAQKATTASLAVSASYAINTTSASYAVSASYAINTTSASYAANATNATNATNANTASYLYPGTYNITASFAISSSFIQTATNASTASISLSPINVVGTTLYSTNPFSTVVIGTSGTGSVLLGNNAAFNATSMQEAIALGSFAGSFVQNGLRSVYIGSNAGLESSGSTSSVFIGRNAGIRASSSINSNFIGEFAGESAHNSQYSNFIGYRAGLYSPNTSYSTYIGYQAGYNVNGGIGQIGLGTNNIIIGTNITLPIQSRDSINLGGIIFATGSYSNTSTDPYSGSAGGRIGINIVSPSTTLDVSGSGRFTNGLTITGSTISTGGFTGSLQGTASWATNFVSAPNYVLNSQTSSFLTTGSFGTTQTISGSLVIDQNLTVLGTQSVQYITSSQLNISTNLITVNTATPAVRFGGLAVADSGSSPIRSGSLLFDSQNNQWVFVHQATSGVTSSVLIMGPQTFNNLGNETNLTNNRIPKSVNTEHIGDSNITDTGTVVSINSNTQITGSLLVSGSATITGSLIQNASTASFGGLVGIGTTTPTVRLDINGNDTTRNTAQFGTIGIQSYTTNNAWFGDNIFFNGTQFIRRANGYTGLFYFQGNEGQFRFGDNGSAGTTVTNGSSGFGLISLKTGLDGTFAVGDMSATSGVYTGANFIVLNSGNVGIGTISPVSKLHIVGTTTIDGSVNQGSNNNNFASYSHVEGDSNYAGLKGYTFTSATGGVIVFEVGSDISAEIGNYVVIDDNTTTKAYKVTSTVYDAFTYLNPVLIITLEDTSFSGSGKVASILTRQLTGGTEIIGYGYGHAEGVGTTTTGLAAHSAGSSTVAVGRYSYAGGEYTIANSDSQTVLGRYNQLINGQGTFVIGNGTSDANRSNLLYASGSQVQITGSLIVSGSSTFTNIGPAIFSGSVTSTTGFTGSFSGSIAEYVPNSATSSFVRNTQTSSFATTGSNSFNGNTTITGSLTVVTGSAIEFQVTNTGVIIGNIASDVHRVTGSLNVSAGITGSLFGTSTTASYVTASAIAGTVTSASYALTASFALNAGTTVSTASLLVTASATSNIITFTKGDASTFTVTVATGSGGASFPFTGDASISGSLTITGSASTLVPLHILSGSTSLLFVSSSGRIGIGITSPTTLLDVNGTGRFTGTLTTAGGTISSTILSNANQILAGTNTATAAVYRNTNTGAPTTAQFVSDRGTTSQGDRTLHYDGVTDGIVFGAYNSNVPARTIARAGIQITNLTNTAGSEAGDLIFLTQTGGTAMSEKMRIFGGGNVNIGSGATNNGFRLDVNGTSQFSGNVTVVSPSSIITAGAGNALRLQIGNTNTYKITNSGAAQTAQVIVAPNGNGAGTLGWGLDPVNNPNTGMFFSAGNNTDQIARASISITNLVNTAGSESADLSFYTKPTAPVNTAMAERMRILGDSRILFTSSFTATATSQSYFQITGSIRQVQTASAQIYGVNITPTMIFTTGSQTQTALRVAPTFSGSVAFTASQQNIIADFGATSVGTQFSVNDVTSGSIYMVNDISGLPILEALSDWTVNMYNYPTRVFQKTGSAVIISGSLTVATGSGIEFQVTNTGVKIGNIVSDTHTITGSVGITGSLTMSPSSSFVLPLTASVSPATGSAYWSGSFLFIYNGTRYMSASFA